MEDIKEVEPLNELLYDLHLRSCMATDPGGESQEDCDHHKDQLRAAVVELIEERSKQRVIEELEALRAFNGSFIGDDGVRKEGWTHHSLIDKRIKELKEAG